MGKTKCYSCFSITLAEWQPVREIIVVYSTYRRIFRERLSVCLFPSFPFGLRKGGGWGGRIDCINS